MSDRPTTAIVGGGLLGLTAAFRLMQAGVDVTVYERAPVLGGLAATADLDGIPVDRFYHVVLPTDDRVRGLAGEVGIGDEQFRFRQTGVGFFQDGELTSMSSLREFATFPGLRARDRARLAAFVARCQVKRGYEDLERIPLEEWLRKTCGDGLWRALWQPLLDSKFDGAYDDLPATYLWARTRRMSGTRDRSAKEVMGTIDGGYQVLVDALEQRIRAGGGTIHTSVPVSAILSSHGRATGVVTANGFRPADHVISTLLPAHGHDLLAPELRLAAGPDRLRYLGVVCLVLRLRHSISPYYSVNITDRRVPLTTVVETTHVVDPGRAGGTLVYAPKYVQPDSPELDRSDAEIRDAYAGHVRTLFPALAANDILASQVARTSIAEPVHVLGAPRGEDLFPAPGLAIASTASVYPELVNGQAVIGVAERLASGVLERLAPAGEHEVAA